MTGAIVVGYGPTGRTVTRLLRENGVSPTVVDLNMDVVRALRDEGASAVYGDARHHGHAGERRTARTPAR